MTVAMRAHRWLGTASILAACGTDGLVAVGTGRDDDRIPLRLVRELRQPDSTQTPVTIVAASITGDTLYLRFEYAGGCGAHEFGLAASTRLVESEPPQVTMILRHDTGDHCRAGLGSNVVASLEPLQRIAGSHTALRIRLYEPWALAPVETSLIYRF